MSNVIKKYVEICYKDGMFKREVADWGPKYLPKDYNIIKVRFLSEMQAADCGFFGSTSWIYYGNVIDFEEATRLFGSDLSYKSILDEMEANKYKACFTQEGSLVIMGDKDVTVSEYIDGFERSKNSYISRIM